MTYEVLARKYRPQTFEDVVAQEHVVRTLQNAVTQSRLSTGYLLCGPRGTGKTTTARILAKAVNCVNGPTPTPCGVCVPCKEIASGSSLDVLEIDAASNTGVDDIRTLRENVRYMPTSGKKRVYIIDEVHRLSGAAFDALLKTLEEPPAHVMFIFATTEPLKVPETILSRTQRFDFKRLSAVDLVARLRAIADKESINISDTALMLLARKAEGSVRDSLSLMDQVAAFATSDITEEIVTSALGLVGGQPLFDFIDAIAAKDAGRAVRLLRGLFDQGIDVADFINELLEHLRSLLILSSDKKSDDLIPHSPDAIAELKRQASQFSTGDIVRMIRMAAEANLSLRSDMDEMLTVELMAIRMAKLESTVQLEEVMRAISSGASGSAALSDLFPSPAEKKKNESLTMVRSVSEPAAPVERTIYSGTVTSETIRTGWSGFLESLRQKSSMLASQMGIATVGAVANNSVIIHFPGAGTTGRQITQSPEQFGILSNALRDYFRAPITITMADTPATDSETTLPPQEKAVDVNQLIDKSPRLKQLIERVDGEVLGVRKHKPTMNDTIG
jgi:DNA polymerase III subunit gamma/tau